MDAYPTDTHYHQRQPQWPPHLLAPNHPQASFPSPPASDHGQHYSQFFQTQAQAQAQQQQQQQQPERPPGDPLNRATSSLSLNLSSLTVASPTNLSPINAPSAATAMSPVTPISPSTNPFGHHHLHSGHSVHNHHPGHGHSHGHAHNHMQSPFTFDPSQSASGQQSPGHYDDQGAPPGSSGGYDARRTPGPSRSSSSGTSPASQLPRKRSFTGNAAPSASAGPSSGGGGNGADGLSINVNPTLVEESMYDDESRDAAMELASAASYDDLEVRTAYGGSSTAGSIGGGSTGAGGGSGGGGSPVDGSGSTSGAEDSFGMMVGGVGGTMNILGKPLATNNFVTKLYQ
ncbi:hypothetical protein GALMADRAFT_207831 [Galerina marginata CBS 339.88]|uniref:Uncharacterized protein n=1 Tax=Galerina marginata (strain CBS 339.88) TaxID=685588 RepID=A0A067TPM1_GALM3|nr:hypothetical protein GALMADRAFT_207831 [Galerina marginata CBS 339.88]